MKKISELRQGFVAHDWVVVATGRAKRPHAFAGGRQPRFIQPKKNCPFERLEKGFLLAYTKKGQHIFNTSLDKNWALQVVANKYPAFRRGGGICPVFQKHGPYQWTEGLGFHEVIVTRDHTRSIARMRDGEVDLLLRAYQERFLALQKEECVEYISIFHNHGPRAGASLSHPHSQLIAIPVLPPDVHRSLHGSTKYFRKHRDCVHCAILKYEMKARERVVYENDCFMVLAPFASKTAFELNIFPKKHGPRFEAIDERERRHLADALRVALKKLFLHLKDPDYNFFFHTAPAHDTKERFPHYHWHVEILPKIAVWAGFEIGTGIEIAVVSPEEATKFLRKIRV